MSIKDTIKEVPFILKAVALILNVVTIILWASKPHMLPCFNASELVLFFHAVGGGTVLLAGMVALYLLDERPGQWAHCLFLCSAGVLLAVMGLVGIIRTLSNDAGSWNLIIAFVCLGTGVVMLVDFVKDRFCK